MTSDEDAGFTDFCIMTESDKPAYFFSMNASQLIFYNMN